MAFPSKESKLSTSPACRRGLHIRLSNLTGTNETERWSTGMVAPIGTTSPLGIGPGARSRRPEFRLARYPGVIKAGITGGTSIDPTMTVVTTPRGIGLRREHDDGAGQCHRCHGTPWRIASAALLKRERCAPVPATLTETSRTDKDT